MSDLDFAEFYAASFGPLTAQLHAFVGDHAEAQDLVQEAFCRAYARWRTLSRFDDPTAWVRRVAWNLATSRWRRLRKLRLWHRDLLTPQIPGPDGNDRDPVEALAKLPDHHRQAIVLHYLAGVSVQEIAEFSDGRHRDGSVAVRRPGAYSLQPGSALPGRYLRGRSRRPRPGP